MTNNEYRDLGARARPSYYWNSVGEGGAPPRRRKQRRGRRGSASKRNGGGSGLAVIILLIVTFAALIGLVLYGFLSSFFNLKSISLAKEGKHTDVEIIAASEIKLGTKVYLINSREAEAKIREKYPEISYAKVEKIFPSEIIIDLVYEVPRYYVYVTGDYYTLSENLYVLERSSSRKECEEMNLVYVVTPKIKRAVTGERLKFEDGETFDYVTKTLDILTASDIYSDVDTLYIESKFDISAVKKGSYKIILGDCHEQELKLKMASAVLNEPIYRGETGVIVNVSNVSECSVKLDKTAKIE